MEGTVLPANADDMTYTWSVANGTGSASIDASGILSAITNGTVDVIATANDASGEMGMTTITISNQSLSFDEIDVNSFVKVYPNPVQNELFIEISESNVTEMNVLYVEDVRDAKVTLMQLAFWYDAITKFGKNSKKSAEFWTDMLYFGMKITTKGQFAPHAKIS